MEAVKKIRNRHMIHGNRYTDDLELVVRVFERALKDINEVCVKCDNAGKPVDPDVIGNIVMEALDI